MGKKIVIAVLALIMFAAIIGIAKARIEASIVVKDSSGNILETVSPGTVAHVYGTYNDLDGNAPASASMQVWFDDDPSSGTGWQSRATLFSDQVNDGETIERTYTMMERGYYQFRWKCAKEAAGTSGISILCTQEVALTLAQVFVIPEPGTLAGLIMALSAFGFLAVKRIRAK